VEPFFKFAFMRNTSRFREEEDGAATVDWIVLTAAIVGVAAGSASTVKGAIESLSSSIGSTISGKTVDNGD